MYTPLTFRQERFVLEYLKDQNASAAAARAGYTAKNMASQGNELMNNPAIRDRVRLEMQNLLAELRCSALELMKQRMRAAFFRAEKLFAQGWEPLPVSEPDEETRRAVEVSTVMRKSGPVVRVKQPDRDRALRALEKAHERLERLNEQYCAKLEKEGKILSLEEIEAMDGGGVEAPGVDISEKDQVLSGSGVAVEKPGIEIHEKTQVLSGRPEKAAAAERRVFLKKPQVLSGSGAQPAARPSAAPGQPAPPRSKVTGPTGPAREWVARAAAHLGIRQSIPEELLPTHEEIRAMVRQRAAEKGIELAPV